MNRNKTSAPPPQVKNTERVTFMDGIRGWAALTVLFYHYLLSFYPAFFKFNDTYVHTSSHIEEQIARTPVSILYNSGFAVCLFFVMSGYALSYKFFITKDTQFLTSSAIRRYFRLAIPVLFSVIVSYFILSIHQYYTASTAQYTQNTFWLSSLWDMAPNFWLMLKEGALTALFKGGTLKYNPTLWTITIEFYGSMLVFATLALFGRMKNRFWIYALLIIVFNNDYLFAFIIGLGLSDLYHTKERKHLPAYLVVLLFIAAFYIGSYQNLPANSFWANLNWLSHINRSYPFIIGASLFLYGSLNSYWVQSIFNARIFQFLGKISFSLYLLHLLILGSFSCFFFNVLYGQLHLTYFLSFICMFIVALSVTITSAYIMYRYVDLNGIKFSKTFYQKFFK